MELHDLPPDPFYDSTSCPLWDCKIATMHTHPDEDLPRNRGVNGYPGSRSSE